MVTVLADTVAMLVNMVFRAEAPRAVLATEKEFFMPVARKDVMDDIPKKELEKVVMLLKSYAGIVVTELQLENVLVSDVQWVVLLNAGRAVRELQPENMLVGPFCVPRVKTGMDVSELQFRNIEALDVTVPKVIDPTEVMLVQPA